MINRKWLLLAILAPAVVAFAVDAAYEAPKATGQQPRDPAAMAKFSPKLLNANPLIGAKVTNDRGEDLGSIEDVVLNAGRDRVDYVALGLGGFLGIGEKFYAVPWDALKVHSSERGKVDKVVVNFSRSEIEATGGFDRNTWPEHGASGLVPRGMRDEKLTPPERMTPAAEKTAPPSARPLHDMTYKAEDKALADRDLPRGMSIRYRRLTEIIGLEAQNLQGEDVGDINDLVLDLREGRPVYAVIGFGGFLGLGEKNAVIPWSIVDVMPRMEAVRIDANKDVLEAIAYEQGSEPNLANMDEAEKLYQRFEEQPYWQTYGYVETTGQVEKKASAEAWKPGSKFNANFKADTIIEKAGTIESIGTFTPAENATPGLRLRVKTDDGKVMTVYAGPRDYFASKGHSFHYGDKITVHGSKTKVDEREVILATKIVHGDKTLELRDKDGTPKWEENIK